jgi:hypothetical protein
MSLESLVRASTAAMLLSCLAWSAQAAPAACPFKPEDLTKVLGTGFAAGQEEPGMGGTSCKYKTTGGSTKNGTDYSVWVLVIKPGPDQDMIRTMTAGGPKARFEPIAGDPDGAARVRGAANDSLIDVVYKRSGHVVFLRALGLGYEPDAKARTARDDAMAAKLLKLPRLP